MTIHSRIVELGTVALDFELPDEQRAELDRHLRGCEACRAILSGYRSDADALRATAFSPAPDRVRAVVLGAAARRPGTNPFRELLIAATLVGLLLAGLAVLTSGQRRDERLVAISPSPAASELATPETVSPRSLTPTIGSRPDNDNPPGIQVATLPFADSADTRRAGIHAMEAAGDCGSGGQTLWYSFIPDRDMVVVVDTFGSGYDTLIDVWTGSLANDLQDPGFERLVPLACNDDAAGTSESEVVFAAAAGTSYVIRVSTVMTDVGGTLQFHVARG